MGGVGFFSRGLSGAGWLSEVALASSGVDDNGCEMTHGQPLGARKRKKKDRANTHHRVRASLAAAIFLATASTLCR
jgi:hypothetical protein